MAGQELGLFLDPAGKLVDVRQWRCASARLLNVILEAGIGLVMPVDVVVHGHAARRRVAGSQLTRSTPGIAANVSALCCSNSGLPLAAGTFMRTRPGT